jgi:type III pantothenate kinase
MDINLLALGVGNSRLAVGVFAAGELRSVERIPISDRAQWQAAIARGWSTFAGVDVAIAAASVNSPLDPQVEEAVQSIARQDLQWIGKQIDLPIGVETREPLKTGIDRILNVAAAYEQMNKACIVVDAGTAITVDCCNDNGDFLGGAIAPGVELMAQSLSTKTAGIGTVSYVIPPSGAFGNDTTSAVSQGIYHSIRGLVREVAENYATHLGQWPEIIATGGDAKLLFDGWELIHAIAPDLGLYGIALAYADHHIRHGT